MVTDLAKIGLYSGSWGGKKGSDDQEPSQNFLALGDCLSCFCDARAGWSILFRFPSCDCAFSDEGGRNDFSYYLSVDIDILQRATILLSIVSQSG
jgi:hypothetical protein